MNPIYDFRDQVALVTGGDSGIGLAAAQAFAEAGAVVVLAAPNEEKLEAAADALVAAGHQAIGVRCDVSKESQVAELTDRTVATYGRLDMAFNNAGIQVLPSDAADENAETFDKVNAINLRGVWACMKHELRHMRAQGGGGSSTAHRWAVSSGSPAVRRTTRRSTESSGPPRAPRSSTRQRMFASTPSARERSRRQWWPRWWRAVSLT
jgi:NAD(P)-dependent dehydrogenase (short-subunit alcohol dehydrogenase family)